MGIWRSQNAFTGGAISEKMFGRVELKQYQDSVAKLLNFKVGPHGGISRRPGTKFGWEVKYSALETRVIPFEFSALVSYVIEAGENYLRFGRNGVLLEDGGSPVELVTPYSEADIPGLAYVQNADVMWIVHENHRPRKLLRYSDTEWYLEPVSLIDGPYYPVNGTANTLVSSAATGSVTVTAANGILITDVSAYFSTLTRVTTAERHGLISGNVVTISGVLGYTDANGDWSVFVDGDYTFYFSLTSAQTYTSGGQLSPNLFVPTDVGRLMRLWHDGDAKWAWGEITGYTSSSVVTVEVVENNFPIVATALWRLGLYSETTGWPGSVMLYEQRLAYAASPNALQRMEFSQTDAFNYFQSAADETLLASDALSWSLFSQQVDNISWMLPGRGGLAVGTSGGCWIVTGAGGKDDPLTPNSVNARKHEAIGATPEVNPAQIDNAVIFVDTSRQRVHEFAYLWEDDTFRAPDLTILAEHLFRTTFIHEIDVQGTAKIIWCVLDDGRLIGLTYMRAESVVAWHEHTTTGLFKSVCAVTEGSYEVPYFVVEREINGSTVKYVEYLADDFNGADIKEAYFMDCGQSAALAPDTAIVAGLDHLEGELVFALADGKVVKNLTVVGGQVTLPYNAETVQVGINFFSDVETLPIELVNDEFGSTIGREKDLGKVALRVTESYGALIGRTFDSLEELQFNEGIQVSTAPTLFSGEKVKDKLDGHPSTDVRVCMRQDRPLPLSVNALVVKLEISEE